MEHPPQVGEDEENASKVYSSIRFPTYVLQNLSHFRSSSKMCDVEIRCKGVVIEAHRLVLAASCPYFSAMFDAGLSEERSRIVELPSVEPDILQSLINFMYSGTIAVNESNVQRLLVVADMLQLVDVVDNCTSFLKDQLHVSNAIGIYRFGEGHNCPDLTKFALGFIYGNFPAISKEEEFLELPKDQVIKFLSSENLRVESELEVLQAAKEWLLHDLSQRHEFILEIFSHVRFLLIHPNLIDRIIRRCSVETVKVALRSIRKEMTTGRGRLFSCSLKPRLDSKKYIFVIGGSDRPSTDHVNISCSQSVERYDTIRNEWRTVSPMSIARSNPGVALLNGTIFVVGGERESQVLANAECYNPCTDSWTRVPSMLQPRCDFGLCAFGNKIYALGGCIGQIYGKSIEWFDPAGGKWIHQTNLLRPRAGLTAVSHEGLIYLIGGNTQFGLSRTDLMSYNPVTFEWTNLASMEVPRYQPSAAILNGTLFVAGGIQEYEEYENSPFMEKYSFERDRWSRTSKMAVVRRNPVLVAAAGMLYLMGGGVYENGRLIAVDTVERYNTATDEWDLSAAPLIEKRHGFVAVVA